MIIPRHVWAQARQGLNNQINLIRIKFFLVTSSGRLCVCPALYVAPNNRCNIAMSKTALIIGDTGQDGSYLAEFLLEKGYEVHGIKGRASLRNTARVDHIYEDLHTDKQRFQLHYRDLTDSSNLTRIISEVQPDEVYNLGAQSHVAVSFEAPEYTAGVDAIGTLRLLEAIPFLGLEKRSRFYQASTSELYGLVQETPQTETTPFHPRSPRAVPWRPNSWFKRAPARPQASTIAQSAPVGKKIYGGRNQQLCASPPNQSVHATFRDRSLRLVKATLKRKGRYARD